MGDPERNNGADRRRRGKRDAARNDSGGLVLWAPCLRVEGGGRRPITTLRRARFGGHALWLERFILFSPTVVAP